MIDRLMIFLVAGVLMGAVTVPAQPPTHPFEQEQARQPLGVYTNIVRIVDLALLPNHAPTWGVTFQTVESNTVRCAILHSHPLIQSNHLETPKMIDLDRRTDFSDLPWYRIVTETTNSWRGRVTLLKSCEPVKMDAEQQGGGYSPPAARSSKPTP